MDDKTARRRFNKAKELERARKLRLDDFIKAAMGTVQGRDYFYWVLEVCRVGRNPFTGNALNTAFNSGELNVGQQVQAHLMEVTPEDYFKMLRERKKEEDDRAIADADSDTDSGDDFDN